MVILLICLGDFRANRSWDIAVVWLRFRQSRKRIAKVDSSTASTILVRFCMNSKGITEFRMGERRFQEGGVGVYIESGHEKLCVKISPRV